MTDAATTLEQAEHKGRRMQDVSAEDRTKVIVLAQVFAIVALLVLWSIIRGKRAAAKPTS